MFFYCTISNQLLEIFYYGKKILLHFKKQVIKEIKGSRIVVEVARCYNLSAIILSRMANGWSLGMESPMKIDFLHTNSIGWL